MSLGDVAVWTVFGAGFFVGAMGMLMALFLFALCANGQEDR